MSPHNKKRRSSSAGSEPDAAAVEPAAAEPSEAAVESEAAPEEVLGEKRKASTPPASPSDMLDLGNDAEEDEEDGAEAVEEQEQEAAANVGGVEEDAAMQDASPARPEVAVKVEEDAGSKVESLACLAHGCDGTVAISADLCRFGHGVRVRCAGGKECHRFKWCNRLYLLVAVEEWPVHQSWCAGNRTDHTVPLDAELLKDAEQGAAAKTEGAEAGGSEEAADAEEGGGERSEDKAEEKDEEEKEEEEAAKAAAAAATGELENVDEQVGGDVRNILALHRKAILCGDTTCIRLWSKTLREHRSRTLVVSDISRAKLAASGNPISEATEALFTSVVKGDLQGLDKALKQEGVDVNATDGSKNTPLHWAASSGGVDAGRMLLDAGADLTTRGHGGDQPLHIAAAHGRVAFLQLLLSRGADLDSLNDGACLSFAVLITTLASFLSCPNHDPCST